MREAITYLVKNKLVDEDLAAEVLGENISVEQTINNDHVSFYVPVTFNEEVDITKNLVVSGGLTVEGATAFGTATGTSLDLSGDLKAANVVYEVKAGSGLSVDSNKQTPTLSNSGVLSLGGKTGAVTLEAGTGITVSGNTITNKDLGTSVMTFKTYSVSGQTDITAGSNTDAFTFVAGNGLSLTTDATNNELTITGVGSDLNVSGWTDGGTSVALSTITDSVGIGIESATSKLHVVGSTNLAGNTVIGGATTDTITFTGRVANGTSLLPNTDLGSDLGSSAKRFNNIWVANLNSNAQSSFAGQTTFTYEPTSAAYTEASVIINPTAPINEGFVFGTGTAGYQKTGIDEDGDLTVGYSGLVSIPSSDYPLSIYNHGTTRIAYFDTDGNLNLNGTILSSSGASLSGDLTLTTGSSIISSTNAVNALSIANASSVDFVSFDTLNSRVGIGTTTPTSTFSIGSSNEFQINSTGNIIKLNNVTTSFPSSQGVANSSLRNDGSGNLTWADPASTGVIGYWNRVSTYMSPFNVGDSVGIGLSTPLAKLHVLGTTEQMRLIILH